MSNKRLIKRRKKNAQEFFEKNLDIFIYFMLKNIFLKIAFLIFDI
jgi:hypothetical protein